MKRKAYRSMESRNQVNRRDFLKAGSLVGTGLVLGSPGLWAQDKEKQTPPPRIKTNIDEVLKIPKTAHSLPGPFPGKVVEVHNDKAIQDDKPVPKIVESMFQDGLEKLTGKNMKKSFGLFFNKKDIIGIKVNPVGPGLISTRLELVDVIIDWLRDNGIKKENIVIWDRFDYMLTDAGYTAERFPDIRIEGLQTMDEAAQEKAMKDETPDNSKWLNKDGHHVSENNFDKEVYYWADVDGPKDLPYLNQHVFNGKHSYFGKLITQKLTKIINVPVFKNTGSGISMATKNMGYGAICNTNRLHRPLFFDVCTEVLAFPAVRDKMVLNVTDAFFGQYDGGPGANAKFIYPYNRLFFATDPFALDRVCQDLIVKKRKEMNVKTNEHPRYTEYLRYAQRLNLGIGDMEKIEHVRI